MRVHAGRAASAAGILPPEQSPAGRRIAARLTSTAADWEKQFIVPWGPRPVIIEIGDRCHGTRTSFGTLGIEWASLADGMDGMGGLG
jgi:hypothetical protein